MQLVLFLQQDESPPAGIRRNVGLRYLNIDSSDPEATSIFYIDCVSNIYLSVFSYLALKTSTNWVMLRYLKRTIELILNGAISWTFLTTIKSKNPSKTLLIQTC